MALGDAILACLTERPMTGYELAKTFDASIGFYWKANHQQIYRELTRLRDRGHIQGCEVVQTGKPNKLVYTLTPEGSAEGLNPPSIIAHDCPADRVNTEQTIVSGNPSNWTRPRGGLFSASFFSVSAGTGTLPSRNVTWNERLAP